MSSRQNTAFTYDSFTFKSSGLETEVHKLILWSDLNLRLECITSQPPGLFMGSCTLLDTAVSK